MLASNSPQTESGWRVLDSSELDQLILTTFANGGTLRDLFGALGALPDRLIQGSLFREALARYALRAIFDELLQDPLILEALDAVWSGQQDGQTVVEFRFSQPHTLTKRTALGAYKVDLRPTLRFGIDQAGDAQLYPGDVRVRWLLLKENLYIRLRQSKTATGATQAVLHLSAGNVLSQTIPLAVLRIAPRPAAEPAPAPPVQPAPAPVQPTPAPAPVALARESIVAPVPEVVEVFFVLHRLPGRIRLRVASLYRNETQRRRLEKSLLIRAGIQRVTANVLTANVLVAFDASLTAEEVEELVRLILRGHDLSLLQQARQDHAPWHLLDQAAVVQYWGSSPQQGLRTEAIMVRRRDYGPNALPAAITRSGFEIFTEQLKSLPMVLLNASALLSLLTGGLADAAVILGVVFTNAYIGYATESRAERTISALTRGLQPTALAVRDGCVQAIPGEQLVPGDLIILKRGMAVPADARLLSAERLTVDESALTGESVPVTKDATAQLTPEAPLANRANMVFRGTVVTGGSAQALVVATGPATEVGQVQILMAEAEQPETPLQRQLRILSEQMVLLSLGICGGVFAIGLLRGRGVLPMLKTAVSLAVAAVPEGLPTVATTTLALGLRRLEQQHVLVRRLSAVETLGALQEICLDKTGTITRNQMTLVAVFANMTAYTVRDRHFYQGSEAVAVAELPDLVKLLQLTALCSEVEIDEQAGGIQLKGTPTETALVQAALDAGLDIADLRRQHPLQRTRLRSEQRNFMDTLHGDAAQHPLLAIKGSPAEVLAMCRHHFTAGALQPLRTEDRLRISTENERMAGRALRVLGVAYQRGDGDPEQDGDLTWVGLVGIADPPRPEMAELMAQFHRAGIHTTMITGDQSATAYAVAREIGLSHNGQLEMLDSTHLETVAPDVLRTLAQRVDVFSRVSPAHKLKIVQALQHAGHVVAMTGDGINDGPALRAADIGIAMGKDGSQVAQEVADMVVSDDNLATLIGAIEQGRTIYADIKKSVHFILSSNTSEILVTLLATTAGLGEPLNPLQLLWINLVTDIFPELALGVDPPELDVMSLPPRDPQAPMFTPHDRQRIALQGALLTASTLTAYAWGLLHYGVGPRASTMAFTTLTTGQLLHAISCQSETHSIFDPRRPHNPYLPLAVGSGFVLQGLATLTPGLRTLLGSAPLGLLDWAITGATAVTPFIINEMLKALPPLTEQEK